MRFFHISDLHIGKQLYSYSLLPDQRAVLHEITERAKEYHPDAILIAGDVFDRSIPSGEAYTVLDEFLTELSDITPRIPVLLIAGNHDSAERIGCFSEILQSAGVYFSPAFNGSTMTATLTAAPPNTPTNPARTSILMSTNSAKVSGASK